MMPKYNLASCASRMGLEFSWCIPLSLVQAIGIIIVLQFLVCVFIANVPR